MYKMLFSAGGGALALFLVQGYTSQESHVEKVMGATVKIVDKGGSGSGMVISSKWNGTRFDTYILTNEHVIDGDTMVDVLSYRWAGNNMIATVTDTATVVNVDKADDLALVKLDRGDQFPFVAMVAANDPAPLDHVMMVGAALGGDPIVTEGIVTNMEGGKIRESAAITPGDSGGSLYLNGQLVGVPEQVALYGMFEQTQPHMAEAVPISTVHTFLRSVFGKEGM